MELSIVNFGVNQGEYNIVSRQAASVILKWTCPPSVSGIVHYQFWGYSDDNLNIKEADGQNDLTLFLVAKALSVPAW